MAKKSVEGQMDLFELFGSVEELEENVKGVPEVPETLPEEGEPETPAEEEEPSAASKSALKGKGAFAEQIAMQKTFRNCTTKKTAVIAYLNYNKVYQKDWDEEPIIYRFEQSKDAVDYYVSQLEKFSEDKQVEVLKEQEPLMEASVIPWTKE